MWADRLLKLQLQLIVILFDFLEFERERRVRGQKAAKSGESVAAKKGVLETEHRTVATKEKAADQTRR